MHHFINAQAGARRQADDEAMKASFNLLKSRIELACNVLRASGRGSVADQLMASFSPIHNAVSEITAATNGQKPTTAGYGFRLPKADD
ncbi:hypothetical protein [Antarcticirhabdus aurantiaca]|uniref:Uncharacterized protein n=1 Tax=Antarcticirhabdus aurantiaca TaxID=2606717 RepID=A0ACD4NWE0_9HYPH|nr:hypothetical protein [Antarcticirhabdus aurantiaca]WAJ31157.1 hypothetical protein OXU80_13540 [Jeongeuplla avenae]